VKDVLYENIVIDHPSGWPIWIGPAQQSDSVELCAAHPCSLCWPDLPTAKCQGVQYSTYQNITLRNITILSPETSPGVLLADPSSPMKGVTFDSVKVIGQKTPHSILPWKRAPYYECKRVTGGVARGGTSPIPKCFKVNSAAVVHP